MTGSIQISTKLNNGTILVIGGDTVEEFTANVSGLLTNTETDAILGLFGKLVPVEQTFEEASAALNHGFPAATASPLNQQPWQNAAPAAPQGAAPIGKNGLPMRWVPAGTSKAGKPYAAFWGEDRPR